MSLPVQCGIFKYGRVYLNNQTVETDHLNDPISLMDEEALYMVLHNQLDISIDAATLYSHFVKKLPNFPLKYKVYEYFRDEGFVIKGGTNYGLDFTIYRDSPKLCHSEMCAYVIDARDPEQGTMSWQELTTLTRVMPDVMKTLLLCYVFPIFGENTKPVLVMHDIKVLNELTVKPVVSLVRRQSVVSELSIKDSYNKHKNTAKLSNARTDNVLKKPKTRRDLTEVRDKKGSGANQKYWKSLSGAQAQTAPAQEPVPAFGNLPLIGLFSTAFDWLRTGLFGNGQKDTIENQSKEAATHTKRNREQSTSEPSKRNKKMRS
jgi:tRNA-intron lyase